jgi:hypothetical protein
VAGRGTKDDRVLSTTDLDALLHKAIVAEEKLDGANVALWLDGHRIECALRSGAGSADRAGQLGTLRAWVAERTDDLRGLLVGGLALYAEWLYLTHAIRYTSLPAYLVALDIRRPDGSFLTPGDRAAAAMSAGLAVPPELWRGVPGGLEVVERLLGPSRWSAETAEGVVVRTLDGSGSRVAKLLRPGFRTLGDEDWKAGRPRNELAHREASWH